jgi:hypothetical protein
MASGRLLSVVTVCDFSTLATCYAEPNGRVRPKADKQVILCTELSSVVPYRLTLPCGYYQISLHGTATAALKIMRLGQRVLVAFAESELFD